MKHLINIPQQTKASTPWVWKLFGIAMCASILFACIKQVERVCQDNSNCTSTEGTFVCIQKRCIRQICTPDTLQPCYDGAKETSGQGNCHEGRQICIANGTQWSSCYGQTLPREELCDSQDNNCNGQVDEGLDCRCQTGAKQPCYTGSTEHQTAVNAKTSCRRGVQVCGLQQVWGPCLYERLPLQELRRLVQNKANDDAILAHIKGCMDVDIDCDGLPNELAHCTCQATQTRPCHLGPDATTGIGVCHKGTQTCQSNGLWGLCQGDKVALALPTNEDLDPCNGLDDDCDGMIDNQTGTSAPLWRRCKSGCMIQTCPKNQSKNWGLCEQKELCDNQLDDDCDGQIDEADCRND